MRDQWYADNRDLVKWSALQALTAQDRWNLLYVAMKTPDEPPFDGLQLSTGAPLSDAVLGHFRDISKIGQMEWDGDVALHALGDVFEDRGGYFASVEQRAKTLCADSRRRLLVFFDPDTGLEPPSGFSAAHVRLDEASAVFGVLRPRDLFVIYQHARRSKTWIQDVSEALAAALGIEAGNVTAIQCRDLAWDVALLAAEKPE